MDKQTPVRPADHRMMVRHLDQFEWETIRWPGETGKMVFHPRPENPTEPNAGVLRLEPGAHHPLHRHDFAQVWHILEGEFVIGGEKCGPGTVIFHVTDGGTPAREFAGTDDQLNRGIAEILERLKKGEKTLPEPPPYPKR